MDCGVRLINKLYCVELRQISGTVDIATVVQQNRWTLEVKWSNFFLQTLHNIVV